MPPGLRLLPGSCCLLVVLLCVQVDQDWVVNDTVALGGPFLQLANVHFSEQSR